MSANPLVASARSQRKIDPIGEEADSMRRMRETITIWLVGLLCAVTIAAFMILAMSDKIDFKDLKSLFDVIITPLIALLSTVMGFYFGTQAHKPQ